MKQWDESDESRNTDARQGRKSTPTPKFLGTPEAYFVCHIIPNFQISLIYAFIWVSVVHDSDLMALGFIPSSSRILQPFALLKQNSNYKTGNLAEKRVICPLYLILQKIIFDMFQLLWSDFCRSVDSSKIYSTTVNGVLSKIHLVQN